FFQCPATTKCPCLSRPLFDPQPQPKLCSPAAPNPTTPSFTFSFILLTFPFTFYFFPFNSSLSTFPFTFHLSAHPQPLATSNSQLMTAPRYAKLSSSLRSFLAMASVARISASTIPSSREACPASRIICNSASGQTFCKAKAL